MLPTMQGLVEDAMYVSPGDIPLSSKGMRSTFLPHGMSNQKAYRRAHSKGSMQSY